MIKFVLDKDNDVIHIDEAKIKTDYYCSDCSNRLRVKNGDIRVKHFYHVSTKDCGGRGESLVHRMFKDSVLNWKYIKIPIYNLNEKTNRISAYKLKVFNIIASNKEVRLLEGELVPDVILELEHGLKIAIEVCYKNPKTSKQIHLYRKIKLPVLELTINDDLKITKSKLLYSERLDKLKNKQHKEICKRLNPFSLAQYYRFGNEGIYRLKYNEETLRFKARKVSDVDFNHYFTADEIISISYNVVKRFNSFIEWGNYFEDIYEIIFEFYIEQRIRS